MANAFSVNRATADDDKLHGLPPPVFVLFDSGHNSNRKLVSVRELQQAREGAEKYADRVFCYERVPVGGAQCSFNLSVIAKKEVFVRKNFESYGYIDLAALDSWL